jgi:hypothetical protein
VERDYGNLATRLEDSDSRLLLNQNELPQIEFAVQSGGWKERYSETGIMLRVWGEGCRGGRVKVVVELSGFGRSEGTPSSMGSLGLFVDNNWGRAGHSVSEQGV